MTALKETIPSFRVPAPEELEVVTIRLGHKYNTILCTVYVPPGSTADYHDSLRNYIASISNESNRLLVIGDFNYPDICWSFTNCSHRNF